MTTLIYTKGVSGFVPSSLDSHKSGNQVCFRPWRTERSIFQGSTCIHEAEDFGKAVDAVWKAHLVSVRDEEEKPEEVEDQKDENYVVGW